MSTITKITSIGDSHRESGDFPQFSIVHLPVDGIRVKVDADRYMIAQSGMITLHLNIRSPFDALSPNYNVSIPKYSVFSRLSGDISSVKWKIWKG
jgi:hypothetical protein